MCLAAGSRAEELETKRRGRCILIADGSLQGLSYFIVRKRHVCVWFAARAVLLVPILVHM